MFKVIIFDYDGTLFDTRPAIAHCVLRAFEDCGRAVPTLNATAAAVRAGLPLQETLLLLDRRLRNDRTALNELVVTYRKLYRHESAPLVREFPGASDALRQLHAGGARCLVVSNKGVEAIRRSLDEAGLAPFVDLVFGDQPGVPPKPDPTIVADIILPQYSQLQREQILMVGDTEVDILFARRAAISCCWAAYGYGEAGRCRTLLPDYEISSMANLPALVLANPVPPPERERHGPMLA